MERNVRTGVTQPIFSIFVVVTTLCIAGLASAAEPYWPREIEVPEGKIVIYQPQLESFKANRLTASAAPVAPGAISARAAMAAAQVDAPPAEAAPADDDDRFG